MDKITRRTGLKSAVVAIAATKAGTAAPATSWKRQPPPGQPGIQFALMNGYEPDRVTKVGKQIGVNYAICGANLGRVQKGAYEATLAKNEVEFCRRGSDRRGCGEPPRSSRKDQARSRGAR